MRQNELKRLFMENFRSCPPFVFRYAEDTTHVRKWMISKDPQSDNFIIKPMWAYGDFSYTWLELLNILVREDAVLDDQPFENWLLSWAGGVQLNDSQVEELL